MWKSSSVSLRITRCPDGFRASAIHDVLGVLSHSPDTIERMFDTGVDDDTRFDDPGWVPADLDNVEPGSALAAMLDHIDITACSGYDRIRVLRAHERKRSHYAARAYRAMSAVVETYRADPDEQDFAEEAASAEVAAALHLTRRAADIEIGIAMELRSRLPPGVDGAVRRVDRPTPGQGLR